MKQEPLAEKYKSKFGGNTKGITSLAASIKRTKTALGDIGAGFNDSLTQEERITLNNSMAILAKLAMQADSAKVEVKRHAVEKQKLQERLRKEADKAVKAAFPVEQIEDAVVFMEWNHKPYLDRNWVLSIRREMAADQLWHKNRKPDVIGEVRSQANWIIQDYIVDVANEAEVKGCAVAEIMAEAVADFNAKRPAILERYQPLILEIKAAGVAQALEKANSH